MLNLELFNLLELGKKVSHNADQISKLDIREGDLVYVEKGGNHSKVVGVELGKRFVFIATEYIIFVLHETELIRKESDAAHALIRKIVLRNNWKIEHFISRNNGYQWSLWEIIEMLCENIS